MGLETSNANRFNGVIRDNRKKDDYGYSGLYKNKEWKMICETSPTKYFHWMIWNKEQLNQEIDIKTEYITTTANIVYEKIVGLC